MLSKFSIVGSKQYLPANLQTLHLFLLDFIFTIMSDSREAGISFCLYTEYFAWLGLVPSFLKLNNSKNPIIFAYINNILSEKFHPLVTPLRGHTQIDLCTQNVHSTFS